MRLNSRKWPATKTELPLEKATGFRRCFFPYIYICMDECVCPFVERANIEGLRVKGSKFKQCVLPGVRKRKLSAYACKLSGGRLRENFALEYSPELGRGLGEAASTFVTKTDSA